MAHGPFEPLPRSKMIWTFEWPWSTYINRPEILYRFHSNKMFYIPLGLKFQGESESGDIVPIHSLYKAVTDTSGI